MKWHTNKRKWNYSKHIRIVPDSKVHGVNMGPSWVLSAPDDPMLAPCNFISGVPHPLHNIPHGVVLIFCVWVIMLCVSPFPHEHWAIVSHDRSNASEVQSKDMVKSTSTSPDCKVHGVHGTHLGPTGPRWVPCCPYEPCYLGDQCRRLQSVNHVHNLYIILAGSVHILYYIFRKNILQMDVFYKALTDKSVVQQRAYEYPTLLGKANRITLITSYVLLEIKIVTNRSWNSL